MTQTGYSPNQNWFHIRYDTSAPVGLPPVFQAESVARYRDETGTWLIALWVSTRSDSDDVSNCILRIPADQAIAVTKHPDLRSAASQMAGG